jgi:NAD(P)-dependent dehydrogenase (short-subunit alcohol dehydrogenase family)
MKLQAGQTAVVTGAASGFGLEFSLQAAQRGFNVVMSDVQADALELAAQRVQAAGAKVLPCVGDIAQAASVENLLQRTLECFGVPHLLFNNAGVAHSGLIWEHTERDWDWVMGVNLRGVAHGVRLFTPHMLAAARAQADYQGHIINTASMAGLVCAPNMGVYNVTKHAVVALTETLQQDLCLVTNQIRASVLCPHFVPTGISHSHRNRPSELRNAGKPTASQLIAQAMSEKAVSSGKVSAADVAQATFAAIEAGQFYIYSHPHALTPLQTRLEDVLMSRNPTDPFRDRPEIGERLRASLRSGPSD